MSIIVISIVGSNYSNSIFPILSGIIPVIYLVGLYGFSEFTDNIYGLKIVRVKNGDYVVREQRKIMLFRKTWLPHKLDIRHYTMKNSFGLDLKVLYDEEVKFSKKEEALQFLNCIKLDQEKKRKDSIVGIKYEEDCFEINLTK